MSRYRNSNSIDLLGRGINLNTSYPRLAPEADDTGRFQRMLTFAQNNNNVKVIIPNGNYSISSELTYTAGIGHTLILEGENPDGVIITATAAMTAMLSIVGGLNHTIRSIQFKLNNMATQGLNIDSNSANTASQHYAFVEDCLFHMESNTNTAYGIYAGTYGTDVAMLKVSKCSFFSANAVNTGIWFGASNSKNYYVEFCNFSELSVGVRKGDAGVLNLQNCQFSYNATDIKVGSCYLSMVGCGSEDSQQMLTGGPQAIITISGCYWQAFDVTLASPNVISTGGSITLLGNIIMTAGTGAIHIVNTSNFKQDAHDGTFGSITSIGNVYSCDLTTKMNTFFDGSGNNVTDVDDTAYIQANNFQVLSLNDTLATWAGGGFTYYKVDDVLPARIVKGNQREYKSNAQPTFSPLSGTWKEADYVRNYTVSVAGTAGSQYVVKGWICTSPGKSAASWAASKAVTLNEYLQPSTFNGHVYQCTTLGGTPNTGTTEPTWPTASGATVTDANGNVWTESGAAAQWVQDRALTGT